MSNPPRECKANVTYHAYSRCHNLEPMMNYVMMKELLIEVLNMTLDKYVFQLVSYTIMDNHFHFVIKTVEDEATISRIMQFVKSQYARRYNKKMKRTGAFWNERFGDTIIEYSQDPVFYFLWLLWYLAYNPVRANKVIDPRTYRFSSINAYLSEEYISPVKITLHAYFLNLGNSIQDSIQKFLEFEELYRKRLFVGIF